MTLKNTHQSKAKISLIVSDLSTSGVRRQEDTLRPFLLAQCLQKLNYEVEILGLAFDGDSPTIFSKTVTVISFPCQYYSGVVSATQQLLTRIDGDILYALKIKPMSFGVGILKKLIGRRPLIVDIDDWELCWHGGNEWQYRPNLKQLKADIFSKNGALRNTKHPLYLKWMENLTSYADKITTQTSFLQNRFGGTYLPNGKNLELFQPQQYDPQQSRQKYDLSDYRLLMVPGFLSPTQGLEDILMALDYLNQSDLRLVIIGGNSDDDYDRQLRQKWGRWMIKLPQGQMEEMPEIISAAHVIVVPQRDIPTAQCQFPLQLLEGMAMAKPILSMDVGDISQILGGTGLIVEPNSPSQIAKGIEEIFQHWDIAQERGKQARERCLKYYSTDTMARTLSQVLQSLT